jgi:hypothetical protein
MNGILMLADLLTHAEQDVNELIQSGKPHEALAHARFLQSIHAENAAALIARAEAAIRVTVTVEEQVSVEVLA